MPGRNQRGSLAVPKVAATQTDRNVSGNSRACEELGPHIIEKCTVEQTHEAVA
jgi:hypothetical protein